MRNPIVDPDNRFVPAFVQDRVIKAIARAHARVADARRDSRHTESYVKMLVGDAKDLREVFSLVKRGLWKDASRKASSMDTAARENIPDALYDLIEENQRAGRTGRDSW
jgi:hypothetical protein